MKYVLSIDQSTQGTKALIFNDSGAIMARRDVPHEQIINDQGWVSHDPEEILRAVVKAAGEAIAAAGIDPANVECMGISNQRETSVVWEKATGKPVCNAIVWQCGRAWETCERVEAAGYAQLVRSHTGIPISPFFPASKFAWVLQNIPGAAEKAARHELCFGTIDTWLLYCLTDGREYKTDYSNASRTQLFNIHTFTWDADICRAFGIDPADLPRVTDSDAVFGYTNLGGVLPADIPICAVLGDSHAALFGQGCLTRGMAKVTYGTGSSVMMNIGSAPVESKSGLVTSLAWKYRGRVEYVLEGNLNYTGAVIRWLEKDLGLISSAAETETLAKSAHPEDTTYLVPAFTGLGAPYWDSSAKALICGMTRLTGKAELVRAALDSIAYQITDIVSAMERDSGIQLPELFVDGGPTRNGYLMQFQADLLNARVLIPGSEELSAIGAAFMAGICKGIWNEDVFDSMTRTVYSAGMDDAVRDRRLAGWRSSVSLTVGRRA